MNSETRSQKIKSNLSLEKQVTKKDSEILDEVLLLTSELSPLAKQKLAMQLLAEVTQEALS